MTDSEVFSAAAEVEQALAVPADPTAAAFFDVDNTMMVGASIFHFARGLAARDFFDWTDLLRFGLRQARLRVRGESKDDMVSTRESALAFVAGKSVEEIVTLGEEIYDESMADKIWSGTSALAQLHLDSGQRVWLVTATPLELARIIASRLKLTGALGTVAETKDGLYTGHLIGDVLHGEAKAAAVRALAIREGLDLSRCTAYSDSINDLPMLSLVGTAVAVNPDADLRAEARRRGWQIRDFRTGRKAARIGVPTALGVGAVAGAVVAGAAVRRAYAAPHSPLARRTTATRQASLELLTASLDMAAALSSAAVHTTTRAATSAANGTADLARKYQRHTDRRFTSSR
ncbi:HAD superfamily hydrolase (TIGR01490 family) [Jatrophihabitans sp. GAS493]|nr:HAD-IB family hydrolase [Jatrophihabitans sp. GAS493]SOD70662.1 HAD superfamily hydrolase (TIGR01490 family) [Jatrophihabitans sp. GAS493]